MAKKKIIGYCAVDSGQLVIVDPCYLGAWRDGQYRGKDDKSGDGNHYNEACNTTQNEQGGGEILVSGVGGTGVVFSTGWGDGNYPVTAHYGEGDDEGRIMKITIDF